MKAARKARQDEHETPEQARKGDPKERPVVRVPHPKGKQQEKEARENERPQSSEHNDSPQKRGSGNGGAMTHKAESRQTGDPGSPAQ